MSGKRIAATIVLVALAIVACGNPTPAPLEVPQLQATPTITAQPSPTPPAPLAFEVLGENLYEDPVGSLRFLFEVRNINDFDVESLRATVILRDADGEPVASQSGYSRLDVVRLGDTAPVMVVFFLVAPDFATHEVKIEAQEADYLSGLLHPRLAVVDEEGRVGQWVPYEVLGEVQNRGNSAAQSVTVVITCYNEDGNVVAVGTGAPEQRVIPAGGSSEFLASIGAVSGEIATCKVQVEGLTVGDD